MATLTGKKIKDTYDGLVKTSNEAEIPVTGQSLLEDGLGNDTALSLGRVDNGATLTGNVVVTNTGTNARLGVNKTPSKTLDVKTSMGSMTLENSGDFGTKLAFRHTNGTQTASFENNGSENQFMVFRVNGTSETAGNIRFVTNDIEAMRVDENQRVGIGVTQPTAKLDVVATESENIDFEVDEGGVNFDFGSPQGDFRVSGSNAVVMVPEYSLNFGSNFYVDYIDRHLGMGTNSPNDFVQIVGDTDPKTSLSQMSEDNSFSVRPNSNTDTKFTVNRNGTDILLQALNAAGTTAHDIKINPYGGDVFVGTGTEDTFNDAGVIKFDTADYEGASRVVSIQSKGSSSDGGGIILKSNAQTLLSILPNDNGNVDFSLPNLEDYTINSQTSVSITGDEGVDIIANDTINLKRGTTTVVQVLESEITTDELNGINVNGAVKTDSFMFDGLSTAPASATANGRIGEVRVDANYIYVCTATNTWKRVALSTW